MKSGKLTPLQRRVLEHIGRYRLTFQEVVSALFCGGGNPQKVLTQLRDQGLLGIQKGFGGNRAAYILTPLGAAALGVSRRRADTLGPEAMPVHLAILSFCTLCQRARVRLMESEAQDLLGATPPGRYHAAEYGRQAHRVYDLYVPGPATALIDVISRTRAHIQRVRDIAELQPWINHEMYVHAILVETDGRRAEIEAALDDAVIDDCPLREAGAALAVQVPGIAELEEALRVVVQEAQIA